MSAHTPIVWSDPTRELAFAQWLAEQSARHHLRPDSLQPASADASFRRYFRVAVDGSASGGSAPPSLIVMDAPPALEDCAAFDRIARLLRAAGLRAPEVLEWDAAHGFMLIEDLGQRTLLDVLALRDAASAAPLYIAALDALVALQSIEPPADVPHYDAPMLQRELGLFGTWYVHTHCGQVLTDAEQAQLQRCLDAIMAACMEQPQVLVHRDFHSRNLMPQPHDDRAAPGILDFQGAVRGPVTYDLASLLRDAYIEWPEEVQLDWAVRWWERARKAGVPVDGDFGAVWKAFEWTGLQRHLKVLGIFARLSHRDGKQGYLADLPRVWRHAHRVCARYRELTPLALLLERLGGLQRDAGYTF